MLCQQFSPFMSFNAGLYIFMVQWKFKQAFSHSAPGQTLRPAGLQISSVLRCAISKQSHEGRQCSLPTAAIRVLYPPSTQRRGA
ncbi:hypothetical protein AOLI_G00322270 [Acnodon oligacanthus]